MHVSLDRNGKVVQAGEGTFRVPMGADEADNSLSNPVSQAEALHERSRVEYATMAAREHARAERDYQAAQHQAWLDNMATEYEEFISEEASAENGGENPLLYAAAMQSMAGGGMDHFSPISGYLLSQDGQMAFDRAMSGHILHGMGDVQSLIQTAQADVNQARQIADVVRGIAVAPQASASPGASPSPAASAAGESGISELMNQKIAGIPIPFIAAGALAFLFLRRKK